MAGEFRIDTPYLPGEKGCRFTWIINDDEEKTLYLRHEDLNELNELLDHGSTGKIEMEDGASSILVNSDSTCLLYTSPSPRDATLSRMPSSA